MMNGRVRVVEIQAKSILNRAPEGMGFRWTLNPYRGCQHGCVYCYARYTHTFLNLDPDKDFSQTVFVKTNAVTLLRRELRRPRWRHERVSVGTATDPYQPIEGRYRLMPGLIQAFGDFYTPFSIVTKNTMVLRDMALLRQVAQRVSVAVLFSITTVDEALARELEPDTPSPWQRLRVAQRLARAGIPAAIALAPILPGVTDKPGQLRAVVAAVREHGLSIAFYQPLRLYDDTRPTLFSYLARRHPQLVAAYQRGYTRKDPPAAYRESLRERVEAAMREEGGRWFRPPSVQPLQDRLNIEE